VFEIQGTLLSASAGIQQWLLHNNGFSLHTFEKLCGYMKYLTLEWCSDSKKWKLCADV